MRLKPSAATTILSRLTPDPRRESERADADGGLLGSWSATRWQYTSREEAKRSVDVVCDLSGNVTLSLSKGTWVLSWDLPGQGRQSVGGVLAVEGDRLELLAQDAAGPEWLRFRLGPDTLALSTEASGWDFDGNGEQAAEFVAVLVRL